MRWVGVELAADCLGGWLMEGIRGWREMVGRRGGGAWLWGGIEQRGRGRRRGRCWVGVRGQYLEWLDEFGMHFLHEADTGGESHVVVLEIVRPLASVLVDFFGVDLHFLWGKERYQ